MRRLLTKNDLTYLQRALEAGRFILMERELPGLRLTVSTAAAPPVWGVPMLIRLEQARGHVYSTQYFQSVEEMMRYL